MSAKLLDQRNTPRRVLVVGISASGKTTFARRLAREMGLPVHHMDSLFWREDWTEAAEAEVAGKLGQILDGDSWIIEGYIDPLADQRVALAHQIIDLDFSRFRCGIHLLKRWWQCRGEVRPELPRGCIERPSCSFLCTVLRKTERPRIVEALSRGSAKHVRLTSPSESDRFLRSVAIP